MNCFFTNRFSFHFPPQENHIIFHCKRPSKTILLKMKIFRSCLHRHDRQLTFLSTIFVILLASSSTRRTSAEPLWLDVCTQDETKGLPFCDTALNLDERIDDYVKRVPIETQMQMMGHNASGYDDLKIPPYMWWSEGLHGPLEPCVQYKDQCACPTNFPSPSAMGNAFNRTLYRLVGRAIGIQGKAISNLRLHNLDIGDGLTYWSVNHCFDEEMFTIFWPFQDLICDTNVSFIYSYH